jgi:hypothetical protein
MAAPSPVEEEGHGESAEAAGNVTSSSAPQRALGSVTLASIAPPLDCAQQTTKEERQLVKQRLGSDEFDLWIHQCEAAHPQLRRRAELPTHYRPFYTGDLRRDLRTHCFPHGWNVHCWPLLLSFLAVVFTIWGAFSCQYFRGADVGFTSGRYGLWTLEDVYGKCQLWSVLFYSYDLGAPLRWSRVFSMCAMVLGLAVMTTMAQAMQCHLVSWGVGAILSLVFLISVSTTSTFNIWIVWALLTYILYVLIVRACFVHPVARRISQRGCRIISGTQVLCHIFTLLTLVVLKSDYCTCSSLSPGELEGRIQGDPCDGVCALHVSGYMVICASALWLAAAVATLKVGIQPQQLFVATPPENYAHYSRESITTRVRKQLHRVNTFAGTKSVDRKRRREAAKPTSSTATTTTDSQSLPATSSTIPSSRTASSKATGALFPDEDVPGTIPEESKTPATHDYDFPDEDGPDTILEETETPDSHDYEHRDDGTDIGSEALEVAVQSFHRKMSGEDWDEADAPDDGDGWPPQRTRCQKCCCDFRVTPRNRKERCLFWSFRVTLGFIIGMYTFLIMLMIGSRAENLTAQEAPDTTPFFVTDLVCAYDPVDVSQPFQTFASKEGALAAGFEVSHCGACGDCSNLPDIRTYVETRETIANSAKKCGAVNFLGTFDDLVDCLQDKIPFSDDCTVCWAENMRNTGRECLFTCLATLFTGFMSSNNVEGAGNKGWLNHCLYCDEKLSGPAFVTCSGVSRRRLGIDSEIERNPAEQCRSVDLKWTTVDFGGFAS